MRNLFLALLAVPAFAFAQQKDTTFYEYIKYADAEYERDNTSLKALRWYANAITISYTDPEGFNKADQARAFENAGTLAYEYDLFGYAKIFYTRALEINRAIKNQEAIYRLIPKVALSYTAMRDNNENVDPPSVDDFETAEVYYRVIEDPIFQDGVFYAKINGGISDGLYINSIGYGFGTHSSNFEDRGNTRLGKAVIHQLDTNTTWVKIDPINSNEPYYRVYKGDMVQLLSRIPKREYKSIFWELALLQIIFINNNSDPIYDYRQLLVDDNQQLEDDILEIMRLDILSTWEWLRDLEDKSEFGNIFNDKLVSGRYKGKTVFEAMGVTSKDDIRSFLGFVKVFPGKYMGTPWKINETYATWVLNNTPIGFDEFFTYLMAAKTAADYQQLIDFYKKEITEDEFHVRVNMEAEARAKKGEYTTALDINKRGTILATYLDDKTYLGWSAFNRGRIYDYSNTDDSTKFYYEKANQIFIATGELQGQSFCLNNIGSLYDADGQYQEANHYYRQAQAVKKKLIRTSNDKSTLYYSMSKSSSGIGNTEYNLANYDSAIAAYENGIAWADSAESLEAKKYAVSLQTDLARVYKKRGQYGFASQLYNDQIKRYRQLGQDEDVADALDNLADVYWNQGDYRGSYNTYFESYLLKFDLKEWSDAGFSLSNCAQAMWNIGKLDSAIILHEEAIKLRQAGEDKRGEAYAYSKIAALYKELGEPEKAAGYYDQALQTYLDYGDSLKVAELAVDIGDFFEKLKNYSRALEYYQEARKIYANRGMKSDVAKMDAYEGYIYYALKDYRKAEELYRAALAVRKEINERQSIMYSLVDLAWVELYAKYNMDTALVMLNEALQLALETGSTDYEAYCYESIAHAYYYRAETDKAKDYYNRALTLYKANGNVTGQCNMLCNLGSNELNRGNFQNAYGFYEQSLGLAREKKLTVQIANTYNYFAEYYYYTGEFDQSFAVIDSSYRLFAEAKNDYGVANTHIVDGNTHNLIGNAPQSLRQYEIADSIYKFLKDPISRATAINNMGTIRFFQGDYNESIRLFDRCKRILDSTGIRSSLLVTVTGNLGEVYMEKGIWSESERWLNLSIELAQEMGATRSEWGNRVILGKLRIKQGKYRESIEMTQQAYTAFLKSDEKMAIAECATNLGKAYRQLNDLENANKYLNEALNIYRSIGSRKHIWEPLYQLSLVEKSRNNNQLSISYLREAVDTLEHLSGDIVGDPATKKLFAKANDKMEIYQNLIEQLILVGDVNGAWAYQEKLSIYGLTEQTRGDNNTRGAGAANTGNVELEQLELKKDGIYNQLIQEKAKPAGQRSEEKIRELEKRMTVASEEYQKFVQQVQNDPEHAEEFKNVLQPAQLEEYRADLDPDLIIIEYLVTDNRLIIFAASADTLAARIVDVDRLVLEKYVNGYYDLLINKAPFESVDAAAAELYKVLFEPVMPYVKNKKKLALAPTGILFKLPFHSLGTLIDGTMHYMLEDFQMFYVNDITKLLVGKPLNFSTANLLAFGNADRTLPFAEKEVDQISGMFVTSEVFKKDAAKEDLAKNTMKNYTIVHFATHGNLDPISFGKSYLTMAPNLDSGEDGQLTMDEISGGPTLSNCQLIVLSACKTAVNDEKLTSWVNNPAKAFLTKGARSAVASLWNVDDVATGKLMQAFYTNLKAGQSKVEALNNAQLLLLNSEIHSHPYYWSAFELIGKWE